MRQIPTHGIVYEHSVLVPAMRACEENGGSCTSDADVEEASAFIHKTGLRSSSLVRKDPLFQAGDEHNFRR